MNGLGDRGVLVRRLVGCLAGGVLFALMWGPQEGSQSDYGYAFRKAVLSPRIIVFLLLGVLAFLAITLGDHAKPYLTRPGVAPLAAGAITVLAAQTLLHWNDAVGDAKFASVAGAVGATAGLSFVTSAFFQWLAWTQLVVLVAVIGFAAASRNRLLGWVGAIGSILAAIVCVAAHTEVADVAGGVDHSLGSSTAALGYVVLAAAGVAVARSNEQVATTRAFVERVFAWRPGLPLVAAGLVAGPLAFVTATWFAPSGFNSTMYDTHLRFDGTALGPVAVNYLLWLGWALLLAGASAAGFGAFLRIRWLSWLGSLVGLVAVGATLVTLYDISYIGAQEHVDAATGPWQNLGAGGWLACTAFFLIGAGGFLAATSAKALTSAQDILPAAGQPVSAAAAEATGARARFSEGATAGRSLIVVGIALALFYPPTMTLFWQKVLVGEIGVYVLLAVGLNVVVGWAGLLDLGFIAFYAIGSYTTAYLVGSLPMKPPAWLHMSPLLAIPFAIFICLLAGVALGAPTLRLRGDYLAIVTLGFGEIIRITAINADRITNSTRGPSPPVPNPVIHLGPLRLTWGLAQLQYWYLLLVFILIVVVLFYRLEGSRLGRAWAAIREDEVAAQATGINTARVKLLAFAIGASTSGLAGVFFASQVGYFNPDNFLLNNSILVVAYVVFGGMGSLPGAMAGAAALTWLPEFLKDQVPAEDRQMWIGAVVLVMMIFRPAGLIPAKRRKAELTGLDSPLTSETRAVPAAEGM